MKPPAFKQANGVLVRSPSPSPSTNDSSNTTSSYRSSLSMDSGWGSGSDRFSSRNNHNQNPANQSLQYALYHHHKNSTTNFDPNFSSDEGCSPDFHYHFYSNLVKPSLLYNSNQIHTNLPYAQSLVCLNDRHQSDLLVAKNPVQPRPPFRYRRKGLQPPQQPSSGTTIRPKSMYDENYNQNQTGFGQTYDTVSLQNDPQNIYENPDKVSDRNQICNQQSRPVSVAMFDQNCSTPIIDFADHQKTRMFTWDEVKQLLGGATKFESPENQFLETLNQSYANYIKSPDLAGRDFRKSSIIRKNSFLADRVVSIDNNLKTPTSSPVLVNKHENPKVQNVNEENFSSSSDTTPVCARKILTPVKHTSATTVHRSYSMQSDDSTRRSTTARKPREKSWKESDCL